MTSHLAEQIRCQSSLQPIGVVNSERHTRLSEGILFSFSKQIWAVTKFGGLLRSGLAVATFFAAAPQPEGECQGRDRRVLQVVLCTPQDSFCCAIPGGTRTSAEDLLLEWFPIFSKAQCSAAQPAARTLQ